MLYDFHYSPIKFLLTQLASDRIELGHMLYVSVLS